MESLGTHIVDESIEAEQAEGKQSVQEFVNGVEERAQENIDELREKFGEAASGIVDEVTKEVDGYRDTQLKIFDPNFKVDDTASEGAAAWNDKGNGNEIVVDNGALEREKDEGYWDRVGDHEQVHQQEQAIEYNADSVTFQEKTLSVHPTLVEWHAIRSSGQPDSDLTADYRRHAQEGDELAAYIGREAVEDALKSGDIQGLQEKIMIKEIKEKLQKPQTELKVAA